MATLLVDDSGESKFAKITALFSNQDIKFVSSPDDLSGFDASDYQSVCVYPKQYTLGVNELYQCINT